MIDVDSDLYRSLYVSCNYYYYYFKKGVFSFELLEFCLTESFAFLGSNLKRVK